MREQELAAVVAVLVGGGFAQGADAHAGVRGVFRLGVMPVDLEADADTPLFGDDVADAVTAYNNAAASYDRMSGTTTERLDANDLGMSDTLVTFAPGVELGTGPFFTRIEGIAGYGSELRALGVGLYPLNLQIGLPKGLALYGSLGGTASYLTRRQSGGQAGALLSARAAAGVRIAKHLVLELGYSAFVLGGVVDRSRLERMAESYDRDQPPPDPDGAVSAGEGGGLVDLSVGVAF